MLRDGKVLVLEYHQAEQNFSLVSAFFQLVCMFIKEVLKGTGIQKMLFSYLLHKEFLNNTSERNSFP